MKNNVLKTALIVIAVTICFAATASAEVTGQEWKIYYDLVEEWHNQLYLTDNDPFKAYDNAVVTVSSSTGLTKDQIANIEKRVLENRELSDQEWKIYDDLMAALDNLPQNAGRYESEQVHSNIAAKYGITIMQLHEIEYIGYIDDWMWY